MTVLVIGNILSIYYQGVAIAHHNLSYNKYDINVNPKHYENITKNQSFDIENTLFKNTDVLHEDIEISNLNAYDMEAIYE